MLKINKKTKKALSLVSLLFFLFVQLAPLKAATFEVPDTLINNYSNITNPSNAFNGADNDPGSLSSKEQGPKVDVTFTSTGLIQAGTKVTANATPSFFNEASKPDKLYFTWYLKRANCGLTNSSDPGDINACDEDQDNKITVNDWKIAASRIIASKDYDSSETDYTKKIDNSASAYEAIPNFDKDDGWRKGFVEDGNGDLYNENNEDTTDCYVQVPKSGNIYELRKTKQNFDNSCPDGYHRGCVSDQDAKCMILNPEYSQEDADAVIPPATYDIPKGIIDPVKSLFSACALSSEEYGNNSADDYCSIKDLKNFKSGVACRNGATSICIKNDNSDLIFKDSSSKTLGVIVGSKNNNDKMCSAVAKPYDAINKIFFPNTDQLYTDNAKKCSTVQDGLINGTKDEFGNVIIQGNSDLAPTCQFERGANLCEHLFPRLPKDVKNSDGKRAISGDGEFNISEKKFWKLDPERTSTNKSGKNDEEVIVGLGVDKFEWLYSVGDQIGVVVEGDSIFPTKHDDSGYKRMWAFSKGTCDALQDMEDNSKRSFYLEGSGSMKVGFLTSQVDLNDCLEDNLLEPDENGLSKLSVRVDAVPKNPTNDPNGQGDTLNIAAYPANTQNSDGLLYKWYVQKSKDGSIAPIDTTSWKDITSDMIAGGSFTDADREGMGKNNLAIDLNLRDVEEGMNKDSYDGVFYLKIKVKIIGTAADNSQNAEGSIVVRVKQQENEIKAYSVTASSDGMLKMLNLDKDLSGKDFEICDDEQSRNNCYVAKNQIIGLEIPSPESNKLSFFSWKVNGNEMICTSKISTSCSVNGNKLFLPILGNEGESVVVTATAINEKKESIEVHRQFIIGSSKLQIKAADPNISCSFQCLDNSSICPKYLGHYNDLSGAKIPDCSSQVWETRRGNTVTLATYGQSGFDWSIDGQIIPEYQDKNQLPILIDKLPGESYNIGLTTHLLPGDVTLKNNLRKALYKNWGVSPEEAIETNQSTSIQLNVMNGASQTVASAKKESFAASLITHLPDQLLFLFKITLTAATLLISMSLLFALMPQSAMESED